MTARSPHEHHRVSTPLELFFDLVFVVAVARAAAGLHHAIAELHVGAGLIGFAMVFFAIWWAWMNFTWFASAYDCDDVAYRCAVFVQITGALVMAAGIPAMFEAREPNLAVIAGYVIMRMAAVTQWLRAAGADPPRGRTARRYALGVTGVQVLWCTVPLLPRHYSLAAFAAFVLLELAVPIWAERAGTTTWHPHHIAERYGLMTIIVLGESILAATMAVQVTIAAGERVTALAPVIAGGLLIVYGMWWMYFDRPVHDLLTSFRKAIVWGYGHYLVFAAAAAVGAGLAVAVDQAAGRGTIGGVGAAFAVAIPVVVFLLCLWVLHHRPEYRRTVWVGPAAVPIILLAPFTGFGVLLIGLTIAMIIGIKIALRQA